MKIEEKLFSTTQKQETCKDHLVSNETFDLLYNQEYNMLYTSPIPDDLSPYYESNDYISHAKKRRGFIPFIYNIVKSYSLKKKEKLIASFGLEKKLLDVGTGIGSFLQECQKKGWMVSGTEPNEKARSIAKSSGLDVKAELSEMQGDRFSVITLWHVLEHIPNLSETLQLLKQMLSNQGRLIIAVPNFESWDAKYYKEYWAAYDVPRHLWHFSKTSMNKIASEFDMQVEKTLPMKFDSFYVSLLSEKHKTGKSNFVSAFLQGWKSNRQARQENNYSSLIYVLKPI